MKKGRYVDAYKSFCRLRNSELQAARDLFYVHCQLVEEMALLKGTNYFSRFYELFTVPRIRRATLASFVAHRRLGRLLKPLKRRKTLGWLSSPSE